MKFHEIETDTIAFPVYSLEINKLTDLSDIKFPSKHVVLLLAADYSSIPEEEITNLSIQLITQGLKYILCWGVECEKAHDAFDLGNILWEEQMNTQNHVMSTWHNDESFEDTLWFCLYNASPDDEYWSTTSIVVVSIANTITQQQIGYIDDVRALNRAVGV